MELMYGNSEVLHQRCQKSRPMGLSDDVRLYNLRIKVQIWHFSQCTK